MVKVKNWRRATKLAVSVGNWYVVVFLIAAASQTRYNRIMQNPNTQPKEPVVVTARMRRQIAGAVAELDPQQLKITQQLTAAERTWQAASMIDAAERVAVYRLRQREPELDEAEALRIVRGGLLVYFKAKLQHAGTPTNAK